MMQIKKNSSNNAARTIAANRYMQAEKMPQHKNLTVT